MAVVTGDLVDHGSVAEYEHLRALLAPLAMPVFVIPGNHDTREGMREAFGRDGYLPRLHYAVEEYPLRIVEPGGARWSAHRMVSWQGIANR